MKHLPEQYKRSQGYERIAQRAIEQNKEMAELGKLGPESKAESQKEQDLHVVAQRATESQESAELPQTIVS